MYDFQPPKFVKDNLSRDETVALKKLRNIKDIVIKPEDKEPAFVVQNTSSYIHTAMLDLNITKVYQKNDFDKHQKRFRRFLTLLKKC